MLLAEGSKHCCQAAWANTAEQQSHGWASHAWQDLWPSVSLCDWVCPQSCRAAGPHTSLCVAVCCASMSGKQGAVAIFCSPVPAD